MQLYGCCLILKHKQTPLHGALLQVRIIVSVTRNPSAFDHGCAACLSSSFSLLLFTLCLVFFFASHVLLSVTLSPVFSQLRSRSHSREGDEQLGEVREEEEAGEKGRRASKEGRAQRERNGSEGRVDTDKEHQEDLVEKEEDLHQRSISDTDLR